MASGVLKEVGWPDSAIPDALGVIKAESGGRASARNPRTCGGDDHAVGWFQVCTVHEGSCGVPKFNNKHLVEQYLKDPRANAKVALCIWKDAGNTFARDWETWQTGAAQRHRGQDFAVNIHDAPLGDAVDAITAPITGPVNAIADTAGVIADVANRIINPKTWIRIGEGALGGVIVLAGAVALTFLMANKVAKTPAVSAIAGTAPIGKAAKVAKGAGKAVWGEV